MGWFKKDDQPAKKEAPKGLSTQEAAAIALKRLLEKR